MEEGVVGGVVGVLLGDGGGFCGGLRRVWSKFGLWEGLRIKWVGGWFMGG